MAHDDPPYFIDGDGAHQIDHSAAVMRLAAFVGGNGGKEGVINPLDCQCKALSTPGTSIRVTPGAYAIKARHLGGDNQMYVGQVLSDDIVPVTATGSGSGRTDLVMVRIFNPFISGEPQAPGSAGDGKDGPFVQTFIKENVSAGITTVTSLGLNYTAIPIAKITLPPSTATVTQGMITDLRFSAIPKPPDDHDVSNPGPGTPTDVPSSSTSYTDWPAQLSQTVKVPRFATRMRVTIKIQGMVSMTGNFSGKLRLVTGGVTLEEWPVTGLSANSPVNINFTDSYSGLSLIALWGDTVTVKTQIKSNNGANPGTLRFDSGGTATLRATFDSIPWLD